MNRDFGFEFRTGVYFCWFFGLFLLSFFFFKLVYCRALIYAKHVLMPVCIPTQVYSVVCDAL